MARFCKGMNRAAYFVCRNLFTAFCVFASPALAAERDQGILEIQIKDHREAIDDFAKFNITVDKILISPKPGLKFWQTGWKDLRASAETIDLTKFVGKKTARIFRGRIDADAFDGLHLKIKHIDTVLKKKQRSTTVKNTVGPLKISFQVPARGETLVVVDLVVTDFSDHPPRGYELGIKGYELYTDGKLMEKIPPG